MTFFYLFIEFFKAGLFAIGGGLATIPFLSDIADRYPWFDRAMLADMIAISESTPGPIGINMATFAGFRAAGVPGAIVATLSLVFPSVIVIIIVARFLDRFKENFYVQSAFYGLRPAVTGLIAAACFEVFKLSVLNWSVFTQTLAFKDLLNYKSLILFALLFPLILKFKKHPIVYITSAAVVGIIFKF